MIPRFNFAISAFFHRETGVIIYKYKEKLEILSSVRDHRTKKLGNKGGCLHLQIYVLVNI